MKKKEEDLITMKSGMSMALYWEVQTILYWEQT